MIAIESARLTSELESLARFSDAPAPAVTRVVFSKPDLNARAWFIKLLREAELDVREDAAGNTFARWNGSNRSSVPVATGSHIDAVPNGGRFDGTVGVLGGLEAIRALKRARFEPQRPIELILFTSEEPTRFGLGCLGSRLLSGALSGQRAAALRDERGSDLDEVRLEAGFEGSLDRVRLASGAYHAFVELHIEQAPVLEREGIGIGVVTHIAAPASLRVTVDGEGGHAGSVLMPDRRDALTASAEIALAVERTARATAHTDSVATTGLCQVHPGAVNSIPSRVVLGIDVRDTDRERRDAMVAAIQAACGGIERERRVRVAIEVLNADAPAECSPVVRQAVASACSEMGCAFREIVSRAYHDSLFMSRIVPAGMIFIPCRNGVSHRPDEFASSDDIARGVAVLARTLMQLAS